MCVCGLSCSVWVLQLITWCLIIVATKISIALLMLMLWNGLTVVAGVLDTIFRHHRKVELIMVMIIAPTFLNAVQFWVSARPQPHHAWKGGWGGLMVVAWHVGGADPGQLPDGREGVLREAAAHED